VSDILNDYMPIIAATAAVVMLFFFILMIKLSVSLKRLRKRYAQMMNGTGVEDLEQVIIKMQHTIQELQGRSEDHGSQLHHLAASMMKMKGNVGIVRYNAFSSGLGSDLSFSLAVVDEYQSGIVLSGIHSREETYVYAKPVQEGQSEYKLTPEEKQALTQALQKK